MGSIGLPRCLSGKESTCHAGDLDLIPGSRGPLWRRKWQPTPILLPEESHGQRSLEGYSIQILPVGPRISPLVHGNMWH